MARGESAVLQHEQTRGCTLPLYYNQDEISFEVVTGA